jgi:hypothetical protein
LGVLAALASGAAGWTAAAPEVGAPHFRVETPADGRPHRVWVSGLAADTLSALARLDRTETARALAVYTGNTVPGPERPAVLGSHVLDGSGLEFRPRFPFVPGVRYTARFSFAGVRLERAFEVESVEQRDPPRVVAVHPSGATLPENTLRLYVRFSRPMTSHGVERHVRLVGPDGQAVPLAFVEIANGLWDPAQTRLTLLLHPGRVKRGVAPGQKMGPPLSRGGPYRLVVDGAMTDAAGVPLGRSHEHAFDAGEADRASPREDELRVEAPSSLEGPVTLHLPEPLDHGLLQRWVWVEDARGEGMDGEAHVTEAETRWTFVPHRAWSPGQYAVRLRAAVEDRAGNRFDRLFDRATVTAATAEAVAHVLRVPFEVRAEP